MCVNFAARQGIFLQQSCWIAKENNAVWRQKAAQMVCNGYENNFLTPTP